jgi:hypothetical protein
MKGEVKWDWAIKKLKMGNGDYGIREKGTRPVLYFQ